MDAKVNTGSSGSMVAIYWLGGAKAADSNGEFYDGTLDSYAGKTETGGSVSNLERIWTGSKNNGTKAFNSSFPTSLLHNSGELTRDRKVSTRGPFCCA